MRMLDLITLMDPSISSVSAKIHLASHNGRDDPLELYMAGTFQEWQRWQSRQNFERPFVVTLIQMSEPDKWLFAGAYKAKGCKPDGDGFIYTLDERDDCKEMDGRLVVHFCRPSRQPYLRAERWIDQMLVDQIRTVRLSVPEFPGFKGLHISKPQLDMIVRQDTGSWRTALSSVAGVYLIADTKSGRFYVGSATGEGGIWQRWLDYSSTGHGGNRELRALLGTDAPNRAAALQFSVLEIADTHAGEAEIKDRESHWKRVLLTRIHGLNAN